MIPTSGTTGRSKLVMQTHRAYVMAGEGFPYWMQLTSDDRLMTSLPLFHINAPAYSDARLDRGAREPRAAARASRRARSSTRRAGSARPSSTPSAPCSRSSCASPSAPTTPTTRCASATRARRPTRERQVEIEARFGFEIVCGYALSESPYGLIWRHGTRPYGTLGSARQHPELGHVNDAQVVDAGGAAVEPGGTGELELRNPAIMRGYYEMPDETAAVVRRRLATHRRPRDRQRRRHVHVRRAARRR